MSPGWFCSTQFLFDTVSLSFSHDFHQHAKTRSPLFYLCPLALFPFLRAVDLSSSDEIKHVDFKVGTVYLILLNICIWKHETLGEIQGCEATM